MATQKSYNVKFNISYEQNKVKKKTVKKTLQLTKNEQLQPFTHIIHIIILKMRTRYAPAKQKNSIAAHPEYYQSGCLPFVL
jgi:hypothetical protein